MTFQSYQLHRMCLDIELCRAGDTCAGHCTRDPSPTPGCYVGCYYYTDSCFRSDCKKQNNTAQPSMKDES